MGLDLDMFLMDLNKLDLSELNLFCRSLFKSWTLFKFSQDRSDI